MTIAYHHPDGRLTVKSFTSEASADAFTQEIAPKWKRLDGDIHAITISEGRTGYYARLNGSKPGPTAACYDTPEEAAIDLLLWSQGKPARMKEVLYLSKP